MGNHYAKQRPPVTAAAPASQNTGTLLDELRAELPGDFPLGGRLPPRPGPRPSLTGFDPAKVNSVTDLPPRIILGDLDPARCAFSDAGWSACWQGLEPDTQFVMSYASATGVYRIEQTWCGVNGGLAMGRHPTPPITMIGQMYEGFPEAWDTHAKQCLERDYQLTYLAHPRDRPNHCYLPDGPFFQIAIPAPAQDLRRVGDPRARRHGVDAVAHAGERACPSAIPGGQLRRRQGTRVGHRPDGSVFPLGA